MTEISHGPDHRVPAAAGYAGNWPSQRSTGSLQPMPQDRNEAIQWLRAAAAIEVMVWHSDLVAKGISPFSIQTSTYRPMGGIGVEVFFVVSGFLMSFITLSSPSVRQFLAGRVRRIFPLYWAFTFLVILVYLAHPGWHLGGFNLTATSLFASLLLWPQTGYPILTVGWTLEHEIIFYLIVAIFAGTVLSRWPTMRIVLGPFLAFLGLAAVLWPEVASRSPLLSHTFTPYMFAFGFGWLLHSMQVARPAFAGLAIAVFAALATIGLAVADHHDAVVLPRTLLAGLGVAAVLALRPALARTGVLNRMIAGIGEASYSIYLCHWFVLSALGKIIAHLGIDAGADAAVRLLGCLIAIAVGVAFFNLFERPLDRRLRNLSRQRGRMVAAT